MKLMTKLRVVTLALILAGCGGGSDSEPTPIPGVPDTSTDGTTGGSTDDTTGGLTDSPTPAVTFSLGGVVSIVTTENLATQTRTSTSGHFAALRQAKGLKASQLNQFTFLDGNNTQKLKQSKQSAYFAQGYNLKKSAKLSGDEGSSNFFTIDENGKMQFAAQSPHNFRVSYSVVDAKKETLYFAIDQQDFWQSHELVAATDGCAIFKVTIADGSWSCLEKGVVAQSIDDSYRRTMSDDSRKPIQIDGSGNVYVLVHDLIEFDDNGDGTIDRYDVDFGSQATIHKIATDGTAEAITGDNIAIQSFIQVDEGSLVYAYSGDGGSGLSMITNLNGASPSTIRLGEDGFWGDFFYSLDDSNTVIFSQNGSQNKGISFSQPSTQFVGGAETFSLNTASFANNQWDTTPRRVMLADDGSIYGLFEEYVYDEVAGTEEIYANLKRMLPYSTATFSRFSVGNDWWGYFDNGSRSVQISKGFSFYLEDEQHRSFGTRTVVKAVRMVDGLTTNILADEAWTQRYTISNWKLSNDIIYFSGFDNANSVMVAGEIDTLAMKAGKATTEYLVITESASIVGENNQIKDYEVLVATSPDNFTGGNPRIVQTFTDPENIYSASIEFNKWMDITSVNANTSAVYIDKDNTEHDIATMNVWLGRRLHMIFDIDASPQSFTTDPVPYGRKVKLSIGTDAMDSDGIQLITGTANGEAAIESEFDLRPENGFFVSAGEVIANVTDGQVLKYASTNDYDLQAQASLVSNVKSLNHRIEFSTPARMKGRVQFNIADPYQVDYSIVESKPTDADGKEWKWFDGFDVAGDKSAIYLDNWSSTIDPVWHESVWTREVTAIVSVGDQRFIADTSTTLTRIPGHQVDIDGNKFISYWDNNNSVSKLKNIETGAVYTEKPGHHFDTVTKVKYIYSFGEYRDPNGNTIDDWTNIVWVEMSWLNDVTGETFSVSLDWVDESWVDDNGVTVQLPALLIWQNGYHAADLDGDGKFDLANLAVFKGAAGVGGSDNNTEVQGETTSEWQSTWNWVASFTAADFIAANENQQDRWFASTSFGGWGFDLQSNLNFVSLDSNNPDWFSHDWVNAIDTQLNTVESWFHHVIDVTTDAETGVVTMSYKIQNSAGDILNEEQRTLFVDVNEASWPWLLDSQDKGGFEFKLSILSGDIAIDNVKVTDISSDLENVIVEKDFNSGNQDFFTELRSNQ